MVSIKASYTKMLEFLGKKLSLEKEDQEIAESCRCLIKNAIVCWNYLYLSREINREKNEECKIELIEAVRNGSAITWKHFNLHGEFDFSDEKLVDSMDLALPRNYSLEPI